MMHSFWAKFSAMNVLVRVPSIGSKPWKEGTPAP